MEKCRKRRRRRRKKRRDDSPGRWWESCSALFFNVNSGVSIVHVAKQWRHGSAREGEGKGEVLVNFLFSCFCYFARHASGYYIVTQFATKTAPSCFFLPWSSWTVIFFFFSPNRHELHFIWNTTYVQSNIPSTMNNNIDNIFLMQAKENHVQIIAIIICKNLSRSKVIKIFLLLWFELYHGTERSTQVN